MQLGHNHAAAQSAVLGSWMETLIRYVRSDRPDLTNRQMAILLLVYLVDGPHTVRGLAGRLGVSKPVVTRALNTLGALSYIRRRRDDTDLRNIFVERTGPGQDFLDRFAALIEVPSGFERAASRQDFSTGLRPS
jgi:DNA-binding MarR family transcriptional regulator